MTAYYNEIDPYAARWLRNLIAAGHIAPGDVDERSIEDVKPDDLSNYTQCHFFAGIGVWSLALRRAGWPDDRRVWTGSCPCQPFSQAGKGKGTSDERHLWPAWYHLIGVHRPARIFGEQVASPAAVAWADLVQDDLEAVDYAFGAVPFPAAGVGAPHIRDRLYWMADDTKPGRISRRGLAESSDGRGASRLESGRLRDARIGRADDHGAGRQQYAQRDGQSQAGLEAREPGSESRGCGELGDTGGAGSRWHAGSVPSEEGRIAGEVWGELDIALAAGRVGDHHDAGLEGRSVSAGGRSGECSAWTPSDFIWCRDGKWRPIEPGTFPLAHGAPARVGRLRAYGNAIVAEAAKEFILAAGV